MKAFAVAAALLIAAGPAAAADYSQELALMKNVSDYGIKVVIADKNKEPHCEGVEGFYMPNGGNPVLAICVRKGTWNDGYSAVLRHEVVHAIQDCRDANPNHPEKLAAGISPQAAWAAANSIGIPLRKLLRPYVEDGASNHVLHLEAEAFLKMYGMTTPEISEEFDRVCRES